MALKTSNFKCLLAFCGLVYFASTAYFLVFRHNGAKMGPKQKCAETTEKETFEDLAAKWKGKSYGGVDEYIFYHTVRLGMEKSLPNSVPLRPELGPIINDVTSFRYPINRPPCKDDQHFFISVISSTKNFKRRNRIRNAWVRHLNASASYAFVMGRTTNETVQKLIEKESDIFGDIIQIDMVDTYFNLAIKVAALLNWINSYCPLIPFVLKCDDDVYVNVENLAAVLPNLPADEPSIYGSLTSREVLRTNDSFVTIF